MLFTEVSRVDGAKMGVNYGLNKVRFPAPVPVGSKVRGGVLLKSVEDVSGGVQVINEVTIEIQGSDKPCCIAETVSRIYV
jgi:acyl dehydratase